MAINENVLWNKCLDMAEDLINRGYVPNFDVLQLAETLMKLEKEKHEKNSISDSKLTYNDEIESIEYCGEMETIDISVSGDNLFYCNGILTKNSWGLPAALDLFIALIRTEELDSLNQLLMKQLKNRYTDKERLKRFVVGFDRPKMKLYSVEQSAQNNTVQSETPDIPVMDYNKVGPVPKFDKSAFAEFT